MDSDILKNCRGKLIAKGKDIHEINPRNPFNKNKKNLMFISTKLILIN